MRGRRLGIGAAFAVLAGLPHAGGAQQGPNNRAQETGISAIKAEGLRNSEAPVLFHTLTDVFGARLTGSPAHLEAARWALERFRRWGLQNPQLEPFEFGRGWSLEKLTVEMIAPRYMPLIGYAEAWSPPTSGILTGAPIYIGDSSAPEIDQLGARLRRAIVLMHRPQTEFLRADRVQRSDGDGCHGQRGWGHRRHGGHANPDGRPCPAPPNHPCSALGRRGTGSAWRPGLCGPASSRRDRARPRIRLPERRSGDGGDLRLLHA